MDGFQLILRYLLGIDPKPTFDMDLKVLLLTPPMTQLNTPYPATAYLTGFLRKHGVNCEQRDPAMDLVVALFSRAGLTEMRPLVEKKIAEKKADEKKSGENKSDEKIGAKKDPTLSLLKFFLHHFDRYASTVDSVLEFLQGKNPSLSLRINSRKFLPEGPRFQALYQFGASAAENGGKPDQDSGADQDQLAWAFGTLGAQDQAKYLASLYLDDLADVVRYGVDEHFHFSKYGEKLAASQPTFDPLEEALERRTPTLVDVVLEREIVKQLSSIQPDVIGLTVPFPGNVYAAFRIAKVAKAFNPKIRVVLGGGYVNTELRELKDTRVFRYLDAITLDDGERPFLNLLDYFSGKSSREKLCRTMVEWEGRVTLFSDPQAHDIPQKEIGTPTYDGLNLGSYLSLLEFLNPMHRIWSDGRWNKLTLAHGCYWKKCSFCDVTLDYIGRYEANPADLIIDRMIELKKETGQSGFHFVDEAAPPAVLRQLALRLIERQVVVTWWGNIRFEKTFTPELCRLLAESGCVAVSGGLEVASDRLLGLINKGVTVEQVARVTNAFTENGVMVHAYLMYGFPSQTIQETVDSLERVRQLFEAGCIQSAFWHRFSVTAHSPVGKNPEAYGVELLPMEPVSFAKNDLRFRDRSGVDFDELGEGLRRALYNYMNGVGLDLDVRDWFSVKVPRAKVKPDFIQRAIQA
jgi:radical SAM superfamily enzyme YgiQ (UPF0313 family)